MKKFALVGCGRIAERHAENIARVGSLLAVCDIDSRKADAFASTYKARPYHSIDELLATEKDVDVVVVCTPNGLHAEHSIKSLQAKMHVLCEKPLCLTAVAAAQMVETAHFFRRKLFVVKQNRYNEPVQFAKSVLDQNLLGQIHSFQINCFWNRPQAYYDGSWRGRKFPDGGILFTQFSHFIDLLHWLLGDVTGVKGFTANFAKRENFELEDTGVALLRMESGALGTLHYTINAYEQNREGSFTLLGEKGSLKIGGQYLNTLEWFSSSGDIIAPPIAPQPPNEYGYYQGSMSNHHKVYDELLLSLDGKGSLLEAKDAIKTIAIIEQIYAASESC